MGADTISKQRKLTTLWPNLGRLFATGLHLLSQQHTKLGPQSGPELRENQGKGNAILWNDRAHSELYFLYCFIS